ncbi:hypothetical protein Sango_2687000 [Sesamum angolense]|uniref:Reverse transcriptase RNase H-like domain-containing protein n=1 Tax=Sesamum angolense TaxID=2727404 RepID=A0AAE1W2N3_9LAMI|nr:hypothetical protein Sango_2687000 [Sesamum angolense]
MAALSRFISKSIEKGVPFFKALRKAVSFVLVREKDGTHIPIYYVSKVLNGAECGDPSTEKMALALITTARKLRPYFLSYPVVVRTNTPLKQVLGKPEVSGAISKVGNRVERMRHLVNTLNDHQGPGLGRLRI